MTATETIAASIIHVAAWVIPVIVAASVWLYIDESRRERRGRKYAHQHPCNWRPDVDAATVIPLVCPVCDVQFGEGYLNVQDDTVGGWIEKRAHQCTGQVVA